MKAESLVQPGCRALTVQRVPRRRVDDEVGVADEPDLSMKPDRASSLQAGRSTPLGEQGREPTLSAGRQTSRGPLQAGTWVGRKLLNACDPHPLALHDWHARASLNPRTKKVSVSN